jgi:low affinity Fe/Cu permease
VYVFSGVLLQVVVFGSVLGFAPDFALIYCIATAVHSLFGIYLVLRLKRGLHFYCSSAIRAIGQEVRKAERTRDRMVAALRQQRFEANRDGTEEEYRHLVALSNLGTSGLHAKADSFKALRW